MNYHPAAAFFCLEFLPVLVAHLLLREVTVLVLEIAVVKSHDPTEGLCLNVLDEVL